MITLIDAETTFQVVNKKLDPSPFNPDNKLVSLGWSNEKGDEYLCLYHSEQPTSENANERIQKMLDETLVLVAHNAKFDLQWLLECGFSYKGQVYCTMVAQYILNCGLKLPLDLESCCKQHHLELTDKLDIIKEYINQRVSFEDIAWHYVEQYGRQDIALLRGLFVSQLEIFKLDTNSLLQWVSTI